MSKETTSHQKFRNRIEYLRQHLQVFDASIKQTVQWLSNHHYKDEKIYKALGLSQEQYSYLNQPVKDYNRVFAYSKAKNAEHSIIELYNAFTMYMRGILIEMYEYRPFQIVEKATGSPSLTFNQLVKLGSFEKISEHMINTVFRRLEEERSTPKLLDKILNHTEISIEAEIKDEALMYLEMRHLFIHSDGKADEKFISKYNEKMKLKINGKLPTDFKTTQSALKCVSELVLFIDKHLIDREFVISNKKPKAIVNIK